MTQSANPLLTVAMATQALNIEYLKEAIDSILAQTFEEFELLIVFDGCSSERVSQALVEFSDARIRAVWSTKGRGLARSLNLAIRLSKGRYVARMDDDDRCLPERFEKQINELRRSKIDVLGTWAFVIDDEGKRDPNITMRSNARYVNHPIGAVFSNIFIHPSIMMRRSWGLKNRYDGKWGRGQDRELWVRSANVSSFACIDIPLVEYRRSDTIKAARTANVINAYSLIWRNRRRFHIWIPLLLAANLVRHSFYAVMQVVER